MSESFKTVEHSFSGTPEQKSAATVVKFESPDRIDFLPKQMLNNFPRLNGILIQECQTFETVKNDLFTEDFGAIQYLDLCENKIAVIEANAFQHLPKLKWIALDKNQLRSLPHQIFKNNPKIIVIWLFQNKINSITPNFFKNLNELQHASLHTNQCTNKVFGCTSGSCLVAQSEVDSELSACFDNCLDDVECAAKSGKLDNLSGEQIRKNLDLKKTSTLTAIQEDVVNLEKFEEISQELNDLKVHQKFLRNNLALLNQSVADNLSALEKTFEKIQEGSLKIAENCEKVKLEVIEEISLFKENSTKALEENKEEVKDLTKTLVLQMENERLQFKLAKAEYTIDKLSMETELKALKQEVVELKAKQEENKQNLRMEFNEILKKKFEDFTRKLVEDNRP